MYVTDTDFFNVKDVLKQAIFSFNKPIFKIVILFPMCTFKLLFQTKMMTFSFFLLHSVLLSWPTYSRQGDIMQFCQMPLLMSTGPIIHISSVAIHIVQELHKYLMQSISYRIQSLLSVCFYLQENFIYLELLAQDLFYITKAYIFLKKCKY